MLTDKENYLMTLRGEVPEWVPASARQSEDGKKPMAMMFGPPVISRQQSEGGGRDIWGVNYIPTESTGNALIPDNSVFILPIEKLTDWRSVIKAPDVSGVDWEKAIREQLEKAGVEREQTALELTLHFGYFQLLMSFMGFEDGLLAFYEEPEAVHELLEYLSEFYISVANKVIDIYKPDVLSLADDTAAWGAPFISTAMYREFILPHHAKYIKMGIERGILIGMHNCGKCEGLVDTFVEAGINSWNPAQTCNDIKAVKAKYGNKLVIAGAWDPRGRLIEPDVTEEELRQSVRDTMDAYAPGGGYCWGGGFLGAVGDTESARKNAILSDEAVKYGRAFYKR